MAIFSRKKTEDNKQEAAQSAKIDNDKKTSMKDLYQSDGNQPKEIENQDESNKKKYGNAYKVLVRPLITEKVGNLGTISQYAFEVNKTANKIEVKKAIQEVYGINPISVNIINMKGKIIRRGRLSGRRKDWKKAIVALPKGKTISLYEGV